MTKPVFLSLIQSRYRYIDYVEEEISNRKHIDIKSLSNKDMVRAIRNILEEISESQAMSTA
jgi:hypothetical protein